MNVCEIFTSIQGESTYAGLPCTFIRLSGCNLRCTYCDTKYAYEDGIELSVEEILGKVKSAGIDLVEITGGEPLLQEKETDNLIRSLIDHGNDVLIETNGSFSIKGIDKRATVILDVKTPCSGMSDKMDLLNFDRIKKLDEIKFVLCDRNDYEWSKDIIASYRLAEKCKVLLSPVFGALEPRRLAEWILEDRLDVRLNLQLHKYIFGPDARGV